MFPISLLMSFSVGIDHPNTFLGASKSLSTMAGAYFFISAYNKDLMLTLHCFLHFNGQINQSSFAFETCEIVSRNFLDVVYLIETSTIASLVLQSL